jgi:hypothetical protein
MIFNKGDSGKQVLSYIDSTSGKRKHIKEYAIWKDMFRRCYSESVHKNFPSYVGCEVCEQWFIFDVFCDDIKLLPNYDLWLQGGYHLDKDFIVNGCKLYSPETCMFVDCGANGKLSNLQRTPIVNHYKILSLRRMIILDALCERFSQPIKNLDDLFGI